MGEAGTILVNARALSWLFVGGFVLGAVGALNVAGLVAVFGVKEWRW